MALAARIKRLGDGRISNVRRRWCPQCRLGYDHHPLHRLVMRGKGDKPLSQIRLRHGCGSQLEIRRIPPLFSVTPPKTGRSLEVGRLFQTGG
jgi:hypothetical protein